MGRKIFVTYKYGDDDVRPLSAVAKFGTQTTVRHYVDDLQDRLDSHDHINKGEQDDEPLSTFKDETIASKLRNKIFDSSITLILLSKNMRNSLMNEDDQWIPWEISYSLREHSRDGRTSLANALLAIVVPDRLGSYEYFIEDNTCASCHCRTLRTDSSAIFKIIRANMFNHKTPSRSNCPVHASGATPYVGDHSYIPTVKWDDFIGALDGHLQSAIRNNENIDQFDITKTI